MTTFFLSVYRAPAPSLTLNESGCIISFTTRTSSRSSRSDHEGMGRKLLHFLFHTLQIHGRPPPVGCVRSINRPTIGGRILRCRTIPATFSVCRDVSIRRLGTFPAPSATGGGPRLWSSIRLAHRRKRGRVFSCCFFQVDDRGLRLPANSAMDAPSPP